MLLDKRKASLFIKIAAIILVFTFVMWFVAGVVTAPGGFRGLFGGASPSPAQEKRDEITRLEEALRADPQNLEILISLGNKYYDTSQYEQAIKYYSRALTIDPKNVDVRVDIGSSYFSLKQYDKALETFKTATEINPNHVNAWYNLGVVYKAKGDVAGTRLAWERFLALKPKGAEADRVRMELSRLK